MSIFLIVACAILVVVYMTYPRFLHRRLSAARFFKDLPPPQKEQPRLRWGKIHLTIPFFMQLLILLTILAALFFMERRFNAAESKSLGVWIIVDTSASMNTRQQGETRMTAALREVEQAVTTSQKAAKNRPLCFRLSTLDLERRDLVKNSDALVIRQAAKNIVPRPLGTDLDILRRLLNSLKQHSPNPEPCQVSHVVVISDLPAPLWLAENPNLQIIWRDIGLPVDNTGITSLRATRNPLTGVVAEVQVEVTYYGMPPTTTSISITAPGGTKIKDEAILWQRNHTWQGSFAPTRSGLYTFVLSPGGDYNSDDRAVLEIGSGQEIRVDWQIPDRDMMLQLGWTYDDVTPQLRVTTRTDTPANIPTLIIGPGYGPIRSNPVEIRDFLETSPLLVDVNLDVVETLGLPALNVPAGFVPVCRGMDGSTWLAQAENPARAFVPGLPSGTNDITGRFSIVVFFNAVRWLLQKRDMPPLYRLTSPQAPSPAVNRLVLHRDEGNTEREPRSAGKLENLKPIAAKGRTKPIWPILFMCAVVLFLLERLYSIYRPSR